ncbi:MAG: dipeptidase [Gemmatimonadaceae bacterium]
MRRDVSAICALIALAGVASAQTPLSPARMTDSLSDVSPHARALYRTAFVIDMHNDLPTKILDAHYDPDVRHEPRAGHTDLPRLKESGLTAVFLSAWVDASYARHAPDGSWARVQRYLETIHAFADRHPNDLAFATSAADIRHAKRDGKVAILIGVEGGHAIEGSLAHLRALYASGARYLTLTWNNGNAWAGSSIGSHGTRTGGLTGFGRSVIAEMNRLGMLVDVSHVSDETLRDVLAIARAPVIASHSSARALSPHARNLTDDQLRAIAKTGGVINVNFYPRFIDPAYAAGAPHHVTPLSVLIDHIDHIATVAGIDHVGLGSDFDGITATPVGLDDVTTLPRIAQALIDRGYSDDDVLRVLGGNMLRVLQEVVDRAR